MKNLKDLTNLNMIRIVAVISVVVAMLICVFVGNKKNNNNEPIVVSEERNSYEITKQEMLVTENTVQTGTVTVYYLDEAGEEIAEPTVKSGNVGEFYNVERPDIDRYTKSGYEPITRAGKYELGNIDVKFVYKKATSEVSQSILVEGVDGALQNDIILMFNNSRSSRDYAIKIITKDENNNPISGGKFEFSKDDEILRRGTVTDGSFYVGKIAVSEEGTTEYNVVQKSATVGYKKISGTVDLNINSTWNSTSKQFEITVDNSSNKDVNISVNSSDEIIIEVTNEKYKDMYEVEIVNKSDNKLITGSKFKVIKDGNVIVNDFVTDGVLEVGEFSVTSEKVETFMVYEEQTADGYNPVISNDNPGLVEVTSTLNENKGGYDVSVTHNDIPGFTATISNGGKVTIYVESEPKGKCDLSIKKFVSAIDDVKTSNREPAVRLNKENKIVYYQNNEIEKAANEQKVTYTIRMYNESGVTANGKRIIEYIPNGLVYLPNNEKNIEYGWKLYKQDGDGDLVETTDISKATVVATDYLVEEEIEGIDIEDFYDVDNDDIPLDYRDVEIVFEIDEKKITSDDRIIENVVRIEKNDSDGNDKNDVTSEKVYVKYFDLDITKFIEEVKVKNNKGEKTYKVGLEQKGKLFKVDVKKSEVDSTTITVTYGLMVKNIGEIEGYATQLIDYIPADFKLVEDGIWKVKDNVAITSKLENTLIKPGETKTIYITFDWKLSKDNLGSRINEGKIKTYENIYNAKDPTEDNNDKEEMIVALKTGNVWKYIVAAVIITMFCMVGFYVIYLKSKENKNEQ